MANDVNRNIKNYRVRSIAGRINLTLVNAKIWVYIKMDILLFVVATLVYLCEEEIHALGKISLAKLHYFTWEPEFDGLVWAVKEYNSNPDLLLPVGRFLSAELVILLILIIMQVINLIVSNRHEYRKIRNAMSSLDDIALKAEELSKAVFNEEKYQLIEDALDHMQPNEAETLHFDDKDLEGVEAAMNNLLLRIRESYRQQSRFVNDASHELRTPIAVIEGYVNMLSRWGKEDEAVLNESIEAIQKESQHMKYLVEQLLFLARGDSGKTQLDMTKVSIVSMMNDIYEESMMIDEKHIYRFKQAESDITVNCDEKLLKQALRILIDNASKYTKENEEIVLSVGLTDDKKPYMQVQDMGIGMLEVDAVHMFERFYRADASRSYQGTGLGLSIAKWIIDKHKGHFEVTSRVDLGTRIRVVLDAQ